MFVYFSSFTILCLTQRKTPFQERCRKIWFM